MLVCPRRGTQLNGWSSVNFHNHGYKNVALVPRVLRIVPLDVRPKLVALAIAWLDVHWQADVYVPAELLPLVSVA
jgi:hypothetical protein